jgi:hypothetical protein
MQQRPFEVIVSQRDVSYQHKKVLTRLLHMERKALNEN